MITSKRTSINKRVPAIAKFLEKNVSKDILMNGIYDLGCGKYPEYLSNWCSERSIPYIGEDKHQFTGVYNNEYSSAMNKCPCVISSNVLNVLPDYERILYMNDLLSVGVRGGYPSWVFITVYEGDKSGVEKYGRFGDSYQANLTTFDMLTWLEKTFSDFKWERKGKLIYSNIMENEINTNKGED